MSLEEKRGYKQAAFTRLRSSLSRYIALNDIPNVKLCTDKLKFAFAAYEAAHEVVLESVNIEENQATMTRKVSSLCKLKNFLCNLCILLVPA